MKDSHYTFTNLNPTCFQAAIDTDYLYAMSDSHQYRDLPGIEYPPRSETPLNIHNRNELFTKYRSNTPSLSSEDSFDPLHVSDQTQIAGFIVDDFDHESIATVATAGSTRSSNIVQNTNDSVYPRSPDEFAPYYPQLQPEQLQGQTPLPSQPEVHENIPRSASPFDIRQPSALARLAQRALDRPADTGPDWQSQHSTPPQSRLEVDVIDHGIVAFSDSGYASVRNERDKHVSQATQAKNSTQQHVLEEIDHPEAHVLEAEDDYGDTQTIYSDGSSASGSMKETYIAELVEDLSRYMPVVPNVADDAVTERLYSSLPYLLKSFARKIGSLNQCRESRAVMVFVSKYRQ